MTASLQVKIACYVWMEETNSILANVRGQYSTRIRAYVLYYNKVGS